MKTLRIADDLPLPIDAATQTFAFIGRKRSGKTYAAGKLVELLLAAGVQTVVLDTVGNWYALRLAGDGKAASGFDVPIFGGLRGDVALSPHAGELVADALADTGRSAVLDVSQFTGADRKRFATAFGERMWQRKKAESHPHPVHLVIEECQLVIPQFVAKDETRMVGIYEQIVRLGGNYGIGVSMITQRPQSVNKEALTQTECLFVFQVNGVPERKTLKEWVTYQGLDVKLVDELPGLPVGTAYVWSPQWLNLLRKVSIAPKATFDGSSTPKVGDNRERRKPAPLDLADLELRMGVLAEEAKANDPAALKRRILELERQLRERPSAEPMLEPKVERVEVPVVTTEQLAEMAVAVAALKTAADRAAETAGRLCGSLDAAVRSPAHKAAAAIRTTAKRVAIIPKTIPDTTAHHRDPSQKFTAGAEPSGDLTGTQQRMLDTIRMLDTRGITPDRDALARWQGLHPNGSRFGGDLARLREAGYLDGCALTDLGNRLARATPTGPDAALEAIPEGTTRTIVRTLADLDKPISREDLAPLLDLHPNGSRFGSNLAWLRAMQLIPDRGPILLTEAFRR